MLIIEAILLCTVFWGICYLNTGTDEKNIKSFSSYPDEVQSIIKERQDLKAKIKQIAPTISFLSNVLVFSVIFFVLGLFIRQKDFTANFINILFLGQLLNVFDFLVIDMIWWRNSKRIRFSGTENNKSLYRNSKKHFISFVKGILAFVIVAVIDGFVLTWF